MACNLSDVCKRINVKRTLIALTIIFLLYCLPGLSVADSVVVSWDPNAEEDLMGYKIYYGSSPRTYTTVIDVGNVNEYLVENLSEGLTYYFAISAYDTVYNESDYSVEVSITLFSDSQPPYVEKMELISPSRLKIFFTEKLFSGSIKGTENFSIDPFTEIYSLDVDSSYKIITLHTQNHQFDIQYNIKIKDLCDPAQNFVPADYRIIYEFHRSAVIDSISQNNYDLAVLSVNDRYYIDRDYRLKNIPNELLNLTWLRTGNNDKFSTGENFLSFFVDDSIDVYVGYDERILEKPVWLQNWNKTDLVIHDDQNIAFRCYSKVFLSEKVVIGGNYGSDQSNMYIVLVKSFNITIKYPDQPKPDTEVDVVLRDFELLQNYPNPFSAAGGSDYGTQIPFIAKSQGHVTLTIFDLLGKVVKNFEIDLSSAGLHRIPWDATGQDGLPVSSGIYIYRLRTSNFQVSKKLMLMR